MRNIVPLHYAERNLYMMLSAPNAETQFSADFKIQLPEITDSMMNYRNKGNYGSVRICGSESRFNRKNHIYSS